MSILKLARQGAALKAQSAKEPPLWGYAPGAVATGIRQMFLGTDWAMEAGDSWLNGIVLMGLAFKVSAISEVTPFVGEPGKDGELVPASRTGNVAAFLDAFESGNEDYDWRTMMGGVLLGDDCAGNGFLLKRYGRMNQVIGFRWEPHTLVRPKTLGTTQLIDRYEYGAPGSSAIDLEKEQVVHVRSDLLDPADRRLGLSRLAGVVRDVVSDNELSSWLAALLLSGAAPDVIMSPKESTSKSEWSPAKIREVRQLWQSLRRESRGAPFPTPFPMEITPYTHSPEDMQLDQTRQGPAGRILAAMGLNAMALGLPDPNKTYSNLEQALDAAGKRTILPMLSRWGWQIGHQCFDDFGIDKRRYRLAWNTKSVSWLQDETDQLHTRAANTFKHGGYDLYRYKEVIGEKPDPKDKGVTYFDLLATSRPAAPAPKDGAQEESKKSYSILFKASSKYQTEHDQIVLSVGRDMRKDIERFVRGEVTAETLRLRLDETIADAHADLYNLGYEMASGSAADPETVAEIRRQMMDDQSFFSGGLVDDLVKQDPRYLDEEGNLRDDSKALDARLRMYGDRAAGTGNAGWVDGCDDDEEFTWHKPALESCPDCVTYQEFSPYTKSTLPTTPRSGDSQCISNCKCYLTRSDGQASFKPLGD
jgi:hypothetical protein